VKQPVDRHLRDEPYKKLAMLALEEKVAELLAQYDKD
jgi:hypothetical protein